jgi:hypothetical protein
VCDDVNEPEGRSELINRLSFCILLYEIHASLKKHLLTASGFVPGGSGTAIHKKHKITHTHSKQYIIQKYKHNANKITNTKFQPNKYNNQHYNTTLQKTRDLQEIRIQQ